MKELIIEHGFQAITAIIVALAGIWVSGLRDKVASILEGVDKIDTHLENLNGEIVQIKLDEAKCQGEMDVELTKRPNFQQAREIVKEHTAVCPARTKSPT